MLNSQGDTENRGFKNEVSVLNLALSRRSPIKRRKQKSPTVPYRERIMRAQKQKTQAPPHHWSNTMKSKLLKYDRPHKSSHYWRSRNSQKAGSSKHSCCSKASTPLTSQVWVCVCVCVCVLQTQTLCHAVREPPWRQCPQQSRWLTQQRKHTSAYTHTHRNVCIHFGLCPSRAAVYKV